MCSRYAFVPDSAAWADFRAALGALAEEILALAAAPKLAPTDRVPIVVRQPGGPPQLVHARWGFIPHWWSKPELPRLSFNARSEEAAAKPMWRDALRQSRCLIPATTWFEWQHLRGAKIPHALAPDDGRGFMFAGLWSLWRAQKKGSDPISRELGERIHVGSENGSDPFFCTCVIMTTEASAPLRSVHERMPVVLAPSAWDAWLDPAMTDGARALELLRANTVRAVTAVAVR
jgi:putative SOS response-associated peptidase YedK